MSLQAVLCRAAVIPMDLHQAIEAKEHVKVKRESKTLATITFQNFFNKYKKKSGMTGTALTEEQEFRDIYGMDVVEIPTNRPVHAKGPMTTLYYMTKKEKFNAVVDEMKEAHSKGTACSGWHHHYRDFGAAYPVC